MKVALDTNVLTSGLAYPDSDSGRVVGASRERRFDLVVSKQQRGEIGRVLAYPTIRTRLGWSDAKIGAFLSQLRHEAATPAARRVAVSFFRDRSQTGEHVTSALRARGVAS